jgi:hypothetical protein
MRRVGLRGRLLDLQLNGTSNFNVDSTGRTSFPLGTAALPALYPGADTNTGIYSPGADQVAVATNGTGRLFVNSAGSVGIGTANPAAPLQVNGSIRLAADNSYLSVDNAGDRLGLAKKAGIGPIFAAGSATSFVFSHSSGTGIADPANQTFSERLRITSTGLVGIGVTAPSSLLHLADAGNITVGTTTGTKIGTATTQKLGFYNATPVVQPAAVTDITTTATAGRFRLLMAR